MLRGNHQATVDAKGRLKIPAAFLPDLRKLGDDFYVTSEDGNFAKLYPMKEWEAIEEKLAKVPSHNPTKRKFLALTSYYGQAVSTDGQGRVLIPAVLREAAQLAGEEVVVLGSQRYLEIWNRARFLEKEVRGNAWTADDSKNMGELGV
ncbi:MAG: division/cell wall cluster transcriptional repressor MraZ [Acidobacteriota bacterium]|nr:division/cell wall cluster transcriptional repressor MraZ [Acidobacteriota bacterium]